ncbi:hypothetical protein YC2023_024261 [Brassica napus]
MTASSSFQSNQDESLWDSSFPVWEYDSFFVGIPVSQFGHRTASSSFQSNQDESLFSQFGNRTASSSFQSNQDESLCDSSFPVWEYDRFFVVPIKPGLITLWFQFPSLGIGQLLRRFNQTRMNHFVIPVSQFGNMTASSSFQSNQDESLCDSSFPVWEYDSFFVVIPVSQFGNRTVALSFQSNQDESLCDSSFAVWEYDSFFIVPIKPG